MSWCVAVDDAAALALGRCCPALRVLSFHGNQRITDAGVDAVAAGCPRLEALDLNGCARVTDYLRRTGRMVGLFPGVRKWTLHT